MSEHVLESQFSLAIERALNAPGRPTRVVRVNSGTFLKRNERGRVVGAVRGAPAGTADLIACAGPLGLYIEIEVKADGGKLRATQRAREATITRLGGLYFVARYNDAETLAGNVARVLAALDDAVRTRRPA